MDPAKSRDHLRSKVSWYMPIGSLVSLTLYDHNGDKYILSGIVLSGIFKAEETRYPSVLVYLIKQQYTIDISAGQIELLSDGLTE